MSNPSELDSPYNGLTADARLPQILAFANQKGGVGKTTTVINLATGLAAADKRVLILDLDPQGNASTGLGIEHAKREKNMYSLLIGEADLAQSLQPTQIPGLDIVAANVDLSGAELDLIDMERRSHRLYDALMQGLPTLSYGYDYILIDCPPSLGLLTLNALVAADGVLVPLQCEFFALEGLSQLMRTIDRVRNAHNPRLALKGVVLTMYDKRNNLSDQVAADVRGYLGDRVYDTMIPRNVRLSEAPSHGQPALIYDHRAPGSEAYIRLAAEVMRRDREAAKGTP